MAGSVVGKSVTKEFIGSGEPLVGQCKESGELTVSKEPQSFSQTCGQKVPGVLQQCQWEHVLWGSSQEVNLKG